MVEKKDTWHRQQILITLEQHEWLRAQSFFKRVSIGDLIRDLIDEAMKEDKTQKPPHPR